MLFKRVRAFSRAPRLDLVTEGARHERRAPILSESLIGKFTHMETTYSLSRHAFLCVARRYCVFLDVKNDRYFAVQREEIESLGPWLDGWTSSIARKDIRSRPSDSAASIASELSRRGILTTLSGDAKLVRPETIIPPTDSVTANVSHPGAGALLRHGINLLSSVARARRQFEKHSLESMTHNVAARRYRATSRYRVDVERELYLVSVFNMWRSYYARPYVCLFDSICLLEFLAQYAFLPRLVFGVNAEPFQAHCWLQEERTVLNDTVERVCAYTPIMSV
jgi:hypothetical protein